MLSTGPTPSSFLALTFPLPRLGPGQDQTPVAQGRGHNAPIRWLDWSRDGRHLRSQGQDLQLLHWEAATGKLLQDWDKVSGVSWASSTCVLTFDSLGLWGGEGGVQCAAASESLVAAGDTAGRLRLASVPAGQAATQSKEVQAHGENTTALAFLQGGDSLVSAGGREAAIMQWRL